MKFITLFSHFLLLLLLLPGLPVQLYAQGPAWNSFNYQHLYYEHSIGNWYHKTGDDTSYASVETDSVDWVLLQPDVQIKHAGLQWYKAHITLSSKPDSLETLAIMFNQTVSAYQVFWDGQLIGENGTVAALFKDEIPGQLKRVYKIDPAQSKPGQHVLAVRLSNHHTNMKNPLGSVSIGYHYNLFYNYAQKGSHFLFTGGALLFAGLTCIALFFAGGRHRSYLLFAIFCFFMLFVDIYPTLLLYNDINIAHLQLINWLNKTGRILSLFFLFLFVIFTYHIPWKRYTIPAALVLLGVSIWTNLSFGFKYYVVYMELLPLLVIGLVLYAIAKKTTGSLAFFTGFIVWRLSDHPAWFPVLAKHHVLVYMTGDVFFLFCVMLSISLIIHEQNQVLQQIKLRSSRLEVDLLKKNIQPHYILNTLQSIMNWIGVKPENAQALIEALAEEFRSINQISDKKLIPIHQEIDLCNTHLKIIGLRMGAEYKLVTENIDDTETVPPMLFHTLVENALTHSFKTLEAGTIRLSRIKSDKQTTFQISNNGSRLKYLYQKNRNDIKEGMGLQYIKARLNESYPGKWGLDYQLDETEWRVTISIAQ